MRTFCYFILTAFVATGAIFAGLNQHRVVLGYTVAGIAWCLLFHWLLKKK